MTKSKIIQLGLRENWGQFFLLVLVNAFVGAMVGLRSAIGLIAGLTLASGVVVIVRMTETHSKK